MKRFFAFLLTLAMLLSLPVTAFAAGDETDKLTLRDMVSNLALGDEAVTITDFSTHWYTDYSPEGNVTFTWASGDASIIKTEVIGKVSTDSGNGSGTVFVKEEVKLIPVSNGETTVTVTASTGESVTVHVKVQVPGFNVYFYDDNPDSADVKMAGELFCFVGSTLTEDLFPTIERNGMKIASWKIQKYKGGKWRADSNLRVPLTFEVATGDLRFYPEWKPVASSGSITAGEKTYDSLAEAVKTVDSNTQISVAEATTIAGVDVEAGSTVTAVTETAASATNETANTTVTPKTLTISKDGEETKTVKAYVVSGGTGDEAKSTVVTNVAKDSSVVNETNSGDVSDYVNVAQVLANAATGSKKDGEAATFDASSITGMELSLITKNTNNAGTVTNETLQAAINDVNVTVFDVYPLAKVTTKTTVDGTTSTETYEYDASNDLATGATFTFRLPVGNGLDAGKTAKLTHYHQEESGEWSTETIYGIVDQYGLVTVTLDKFSYITVDGLEYEVFGEVYDFDAVFGNKNEFNITFLYDESIRDNLDGYAVKLYLDDNGTERELTETSGSDYLNSDITTYKTDGVKTGSSGAKYQVFTVKMFAKYFASDIIVKLVKNDEAVNITSYNNSAFGISAEVGTQFGYSMVDFVDLKIAGFNAVSDSANAAKYTTLKSAITAYGSALSALD